MHNTTPESAGSLRQPVASPAAPSDTDTNPVVKAATNTRMAVPPVSGPDRGDTCPRSSTTNKLGTTKLGTTNKLVVGHSTSHESRMTFRHRRLRVRVRVCGTAAVSLGRRAAGATSMAHRAPRLWAPNLTQGSVHSWHGPQVDKKRAIGTLRQVGGCVPTP